MRLLPAFVFASSALAQGGPIVVVNAANGPGTNSRNYVGFTALFDR